MKVVEEFDVACPIARVYREINNISEIGYAVSGVQEVRAISDDESEWVVAVRAGIITRKFLVHGTITERQPPNGLTFEGDTQDVKVRGSITLTSIDAGHTRCAAVVESEISGALAPLIEIMAKGPQQRMIAETIANLRARLEGAATGAPRTVGTSATPRRPSSGKRWRRAVAAWIAGPGNEAAGASAVDRPPIEAKPSIFAGGPLTAAIKTADELTATHHKRPAYPHVFNPIKVGPVEIANRFYLPPHGVRLIAAGPGGTSVPSERFAQYYGERARGGVGLLIHSISLPPLSRTLNSAAHPDSVPAFARVADIVHQAGAKIFGQLHLSSITGGNWDSLSPALPVFAPSDVQRVEHFGVFKAMSKREIDLFVAANALSARNLRAAGYDGIEIHCSHGVLIEQFLSPYYNHRDDEYGGSLENRMRLLVEVLTAIRREGGDGMAYGLRLNCDEMLDGGLGQDDAREVLSILCEKGLIDFADLDVAIEPQQAPLMTAPPFIAPLHISSFIDSVRRGAKGIPVIGTLGRVTSLAQAEDAIASGLVEMVGAARALIAEPELVKNARNGVEERSRECLACNHCLATLLAGSYGCVINPATGREDRWGLAVTKPTSSPEKIVIIGGGPAGLEAARVAAERGHRVVVFEQRDRLGGQLNLWGQLADREGYLQTPLWYENRLRELQVTVHTGVAATLDIIRGERPDTVIVASGSSYARDGETSMLASPLPGWDRSNIYSPEDILEKGLRPGRRVVILDEEGIHTAPGIAELLAAAGADVTIVTRHFHLGPYLLNDMHLPLILPRLASLGVAIRTTSLIKQIGDDVIVFDILTNMEDTIEDVDAVVLCGKRTAPPGLVTELSGEFERVLVIGDALAPRGLAEATYEGHKFARMIGEPNAPKEMADALYPPWLLKEAAAMAGAEGSPALAAG